MSNCLNPSVSQAKPDAGKLVVATIALLLASTSSILIVCYCPIGGGAESLFSPIFISSA
jgi:hypothetical protein